MTRETKNLKIGACLMKKLYFRCSKVEEVRDTCTLQGIKLGK